MHIAGILLMGLKQERVDRRDHGIVAGLHLFCLPVKAAALGLIPVQGLDDRLFPGNADDQRLPENLFGGLHIIVVQRVGKGDQDAVPFLMQRQEPMLQIDLHLAPLHHLRFNLRHGRLDIGKSQLIGQDLQQIVLVNQIEVHHELAELGGAVFLLAVEHHGQISLADIAQFNQQGAEGHGHRPGPQGILHLLLAHILQFFQNTEQAALAG